jgi:hypothetical protein
VRLGEHNLDSGNSPNEWFLAPAIGIAIGTACFDTATNADASEEINVEASWHASQSEEAWA